MKKTLGLFLFVLLNSVSATNYYVSSSGGLDTNTGKSTTAAWKSITKVNLMMTSFVSKDTVFLKCGDTFTDQLNITKTGSATLPIVFASYGTGAKPLINTAITLTGWTVTANPKIWVANYTGTLPTIRYVTINDKVQQIGRFPDVTAVNDGFLYSDACWSFNKFRDSTMKASVQDWTGATAVMYTRPYRLEGVKVIKHQLDTLTTNPTTSLIHIGYGFFIQNHLATLTTQGEWFYDSVAKKVYLYSATNPSTVKVQASGTKSSILVSSGMTGISIKNLAFQNADSIAISMTTGSYVSVDNCTFSNTLYGIWAATSNNITVSNCNFTDIYNVAIGTTAMSLNINVTNNTIKRNALNMSLSDITNNNYKAAISIYATNALISYNDIDSCGYIGVYYNGYGNTISHNKIGNYNMRMFDGGGIYSFGTWSLVPALGINKYGNNLIENNYVHDGVGYLLGTSEKDSYNRRPGIYNDATTEYNTVRKNILYNTNGILLAANHHHIVSENTIYNSDAFNTAHPDMLTVNHEAFSAFQTITKNTYYNATCKINFNPYKGFSVGRAKDTVMAMTNQGHRVTQNIFYSSRNSRQLPMSFTSGFENYPQYFNVLDSNYYWQPFALDTMVASMVDSGYVKTRRVVYGQKAWKQAFEPNSIFRLAEYPATFTAPGLNLFATNSTFDTAVSSGWYYDSENVTTPGSWVSAGGLDGGCAVLDLTTADPSPLKLSSVRFYRSMGTVSEGDIYLLKFSTISNTNSAKFCINMSSSTGTSPKTYSTSTTRKEYSIPISFNDNCAGVFQYLYFTLHDKNAKIWLDNISLQKVTVTQTAPAAVMRFDVNPTDNPMSINLGSSIYKDVTGKSYSGVYQLEPYGSRILQFVSVISTVNSTQQLEGNESQLRFQVYPTPNPKAKALKLSINTPVTEMLTLKIISMNGDQLYNQKIALNEGNTVIDLPSLPKGVYLLESISSNGNSRVIKFIQ